jgi:hypothetical protein
MNLSVAARTLVMMYSCSRSSSLRFFADRLPVKARANERNEEPFYHLFWNEPFALLHGFSMASIPSIEQVCSSHSLCDENHIMRPVIALQWRPRRELYARLQ